MMAFYRRVDPNALVDAACGREMGFDQGSGALNDVLSRWSPIGVANLTNSTAD